MKHTFISLLVYASFVYSSSSAKTIIADGQTLASSAGAFALGFFSPDPASRSRYLGIWYKNIPIQTVVWVANGDSPLTDTTGVLNLSTNGNLVLSDHSGHSFWSTNASSVDNPVVKLLDSGNLVLTVGSTHIWQSFDHPSNTLLPGMRLGWDSTTNINRKLTSWTSPSDPRPGPYTYKLDLTGTPEIFLRNGSIPVCRSGPWNGHGFDGLPSMRSNKYFTYQLINDSHDLYYHYNTADTSVTSLLILDSAGALHRLVLLGHQWSSYWTFPADGCDNFAACGSNAACHIDSVVTCECLRGFKPRMAKEWVLREWSGGCSRRVELDCGKASESSDGFVKVSGLKLPDTSNALVNGNMDFNGCRNWCLKDCSCKAFAISGGSGCVIWVQDLLDIRQFANEGEDLYVRLAASELDSIKRGSTKKKLMIILILVFGIFSIVLGGLLLWKMDRKKGIRSSYFLSQEIRGQDTELTFFDLSTIKSVTDRFSVENILGEGGFGLVYWGQLVNGEEIAVKRLSNDSMQGPDEFKNEVMLIAKLQHRNLVRLLGCCIHGTERMLI